MRMTEKNVREFDLVSGRSGRLLVILYLVFCFIEIDSDELDGSLGVDTDI